MSEARDPSRPAGRAGRGARRQHLVAVAGPAVEGLLREVAAQIEARRRPLLRFLPSIATLVDLAASTPARRPLAALLDLTGPSVEGLDSVKALRRTWPELPLVAIVAEGAEALGRAALGAGVHDQLLASEVAPRSLERCLRYAIERCALQRALAGERADLAASRASMVGLIEGNADGLVVLDAAGVARFANPAAAALFGLGEREILGRRLGLPLAAGGASELELAGPGGTARVAEVRVAPVSWDGQPAFLASLRDITDRKRAEWALRRSAESFRALADAAPDPIVVQRGDAMLWSNQAFAQLVHADSPEAVRTGRVSAWLEAAPEETPAGVPSERSEAPFMTTLRTDRGASVPVEVRRYSIVFEGADATLSLVRDLAAREQKTRARAQHERLASLGRLAANLGHEINNPLSYVVSNLSFLGSQLAELAARAASEEGVTAMAGEIDEARSAAADALEGAERVAAIVRDVRVLSRIESRELTSIRVPAVLESALRIARGKLAEVAQVSLSLDAVPPVCANDTALLQVFVNLLVNAADACAELPSERHEVQIASFTDTEGRAVIEIRDTGTGISEDIRAHLFEPFFTTKAAGTGFGLAISFAIVESLAGTLTLESAGLRGAVARLVLPPAVEAEAARPAIAGPAPQEAPGAATGASPAGDRERSPSVPPRIVTTAVAPIR